MSAIERLKQFTARINRLMDEREGITGDIADVFQEVKSAGFSGPALRKVIAAMRMDEAKRTEIEAMVEMYRAAVGLARPEAVEMLESGATIRETNRATGVALGTLHRRSKTVAKKKTERVNPETGEITPSEAPPICKDGEREGRVDDVGAADATEIASDTIPPSPADAQPQSAADCDPAAACALPHAVSAGDADEGWERHDGAATFFLGRAVAGGKEPHPSEPDTAKTLATIEAINREAIEKARAKAERPKTHDLSRMSETELVERALSHKPKHLARGMA